MNRFPGARQGVVLVFAAWLVAVPAYAHRPYEYVDASLTDTSGRRLYLVKAFVDGIILPDPVRVIVKDDTGKQLAETPMRNDIAIVCRTKRECLVFGYELPSTMVFPSNVWSVTGPALDSVPMSTRWELVGLGVHVSRYWVAYLVALGAMLLPAVVFLRARRLRAGGTRTALLGGITLGGSVWLCCIWLAVLMSSLSLAFLLLLALLTGGVLWAWRPKWLGSGGEYLTSVLVKTDENDTRVNRK